MRVFVAGGGGVIGRRLIPLLVSGGHRVVASTHSGRSSAALRRLGAEPVTLDGLDALAVTEVVGRSAPDIVVHQMTALAGRSDLRRFDRTFARTNELRTVGTEHLLAAARDAGAGTFIAQSFTGWPNTRAGSRVKTEDEALDPSPPRTQRRTLEAIEHLEHAVTSSPLTGVVLRYGFLYGPGCSDELIGAVRRRRLPIVGGGTGVWSFLHVDDAATATMAAIEHPRPGIYNIVDDDPAPVVEWLPHLAQVVGAPRPMRIPSWLARPVAGEVVVSMMTSIRGSSNAKAKDVLEWNPTWETWRRGFAEGLGLPEPA